jgi:hypothetical protein
LVVGGKRKKEGQKGGGRKRKKDVKYECENDCGYEGTQAEVEQHEIGCTTYLCDGCGKAFSTLRGAEQHEVTCNKWIQLAARSGFSGQCDPGNLNMRERN